MTAHVPDNPGEPAPAADLEYDLAHELPDPCAPGRPQDTAKPTTIHVTTQTAGYDGDYGYDLAHDIPGR